MQLNSKKSRLVLYTESESFGALSKGFCVQSLRFDAHHMPLGEQFKLLPYSALIDKI